MKELREAVWPTETQYALPSVIVTDNEQALRNAIATVFPEVQHLLCTWHLWNTMQTKLTIGEISSKEYKYRKAEAEILFKKAMSTFQEETFKEALTAFENFVQEPGYFNDNAASALAYLKDV